MKDHHILLSEASYQALKAESLIRKTTLRDTLEYLLLTNISPEAQQILRYIDGKEPMKPINTTNAMNPDISPAQTRKPKLPDNPAAIEKIKELWKLETRPSYAEISKIIGYPRSTVGENIKIMKNRGELQD